MLEYDEAVEFEKLWEQFQGELCELEMIKDSGDTGQKNQENRVSQAKTKLLEFMETPGFMPEVFKTLMEQARPKEHVSDGSLSNNLMVGSGSIINYSSNAIGMGSSGNAIPMSVQGGGGGGGGGSAVINFDKELKKIELEESDEEGFSSAKRAHAKLTRIFKDNLKNW